MVTRFTQELEAIHFVTINNISICLKIVVKMMQLMIKATQGLGRSYYVMIIAISRSAQQPVSFCLVDGVNISINKALSKSSVHTHFIVVFKFAQSSLTFDICTCQNAVITRMNVPHW